MPSRIFNRLRNRSGGGSDSRKVVSLIRMLVTKDKNVPEAATAWVASEEEILSEQGGNSIDKKFAEVLARKMASDSILILDYPFLN